MNEPTPRSPLRDIVWEPKCPFDLAVAYEDKETRGRALHLYDHLAQQLLDDYDFQGSWWKLDCLSQPTLLRQAVRAATDANMIVVSIRARPQLPPNLERWLAECLSRRLPAHGALVVFLGTDQKSHRDPAPARASLDHMARAAHLEFFSNTFDLNAGPPEFDASRLWSREKTVTPVLEDILRSHPASPRWGINE